MNRCSLGGYLVNGSAPLPVDPSDHDVEELPRRGCNRLRCRACGALVRSAAGLTLATSSASTDCAALYGVEDLSTAPSLVPTKSFRFYLCRCRRWEQMGPYNALDDPDTDRLPSEPNLPWRCDGHPALELPHELDGVLVTEDTLPVLIAGALRGSVPAGAHPFDRFGSSWAARMHVRLAGTRWANVVEDVAARCLEDPDPGARRAALVVIATVALGGAARRAVALFARDRELFAGAEDLLWRAVAPLVAAPGEARELARAEALSAGRGRAALFAALASGDPEWLAAHAGDVARATPTESAALIKACKQQLPRALRKAAVDAVEETCRSSPS